MWVVCVLSFFFFQAEDGIRDAQESRGLGDVYKRQVFTWQGAVVAATVAALPLVIQTVRVSLSEVSRDVCLLYTSDAADDLLCVDLGGRRIINKKKQVL